MYENNDIFETVIKVDGESVLARMHNFPDADELGPLYMLEQAGTKKFLDRYAPNRIIEIGIGGGYFDEHNQQGRVEKEKGECATTLVAKALGIDKNVRWRKILRFINLNDTGGRRNPRDIAEILKIKNLQNQTAQDDNANWFLLGLFVKYYDYKNGNFTIDHIKQVAEENNVKDFDAKAWFKSGESSLWMHQKMFEYASLEIFKKAREGYLHVKHLDSNGKNIKIAIVKKAKNYRIPAALKARKGFSADVAIVKNLSENTVISKNKMNVKRNMAEVAAVLRVMEQRKKVKLKLFNSPITLDWRDLRADGDVVGAEEWFLHLPLQMVFNGTHKHPNVPKTNLSMKEIEEAVRVGLGDNFLYKKCSEDGSCAKIKKCQWYEFGLQRCRKARYLQFSKKEVLSAAK